MGKTVNLNLPGVTELGRAEMKSVSGGELTRNQEIWLERGISFLLLGAVGVLIYELGRQNG